jgi:hypothetical protein
LNRASKRRARIAASIVSRAVAAKIEFPAREPGRNDAPEDPVGFEPQIFRWCRLRSTVESRGRNAEGGRPSGAKERAASAIDCGGHFDAGGYHGGSLHCMKLRDARPRRRWIVTRRIVRGVP